MAEVPVNHMGAVSPDSQKIVGSMANWAGAIVSLSLIVGAGVWGYKLLVRDVTGLPVVRAIDGPMREQPVDPGGSQAAHQGLAVNKVAAHGSAAAPADRLVLAPPPIKLSSEDAPVKLSGDSKPPASKAGEPSENAADNANNIQSTPEAITAPKPLVTASIDGLVKELTASATGLGEVAKPKEAVAKPKIVKGGIGKSLRPRLRPAGLKKAVQVASVAPVVAAPVDVDANTLPAGTRLVQLGAYASEDIAKSEWDKLQTKFGDYLGDKQRVVQKASSGGRTFYRLRAKGFVDLSDARRLCSALKAENADCIPVVTR
ncbi:SPOR domain-containing protein [Cognatishimia sp. WU-CL00825]|uniref:SPOR domain-containing protein n=1 Tax=Cognatishimia sp. WU-CL00825 TaxID=3127658 RepID=UPI003102EAE1